MNADFAHGNGDFARGNGDFGPVNAEFGPGKGDFGGGRGLWVFAGDYEVAEDGLVDALGEVAEVGADVESGAGEEFGEFVALGDVRVPRDADRATRAQGALPDREGGGQQVERAAGQRIGLEAAVLDAVGRVGDDQVDRIRANQVRGEHGVAVEVRDLARIPGLVRFLAQPELEFQSLAELDLVAPQLPG